jgi:hypothetical protein
MADMSIYRGEYKVYECTASEDGVDLVLTGASIYFAVRASAPDRRTTSDADALIAKSTAVGGGITITDGAAGEFEIEFEKADTNGLDIGTYYYGIEAILSGYTDPVRLSGDIEDSTFTVKADVVRAV